MSHPFANAVVLDTNVVLDWLVFRNPNCASLAFAIEAGQVRWLATEMMRQELAEVLRRGVVKAWSPDEAMLWSAWEKFSHLVPNASLRAIQPNRLGLRCSDPDDQKFIDVAIDNAQWLISRDRAVLKLTRRAGMLGLHILTPEQWEKDQVKKAAEAAL